MIKASIVKAVHSTLSHKKFFEVSDFEISETKTKNSSTETLEIRYRFAEDFYFLADIPSQKSRVKEGEYITETYIINCRVSPGEIAIAEKIAVHDKSGLLQALDEWASRVNEELLAIPVNRQVALQEQQLAELLKNFEQIPDDLFSQDEANQLRQRLDELEKKLIHSAEQSAKDKEELAQKVEAIKADIGTLKHSLNTHKKKSWIGSLSVRFLKWTKDPQNKELLKSGVDLAKALLTNGKDKS